jgi:hypothetical protein
MKQQEQIVTIESVREAIKPQTESCKAWEKSFSNLREAKRKHEEEKDSAQTRLTELVVKIQEALASGKNAHVLEENSFVVKQNRDHLQELIVEMEEKTIPSGEQNLKDAQVALKDAILTNCQGLKNEYRNQLIGKFGEIEQLWGEFTGFFEELRKSLGVQMAWFELDSIRSIPLIDLSPSLQGCIRNPRV